MDVTFRVDVGGTVKAGEWIIVTRVTVCLLDKLKRIVQTTGIEKTGRRRKRNLI